MQIVANFVFVWLFTAEMATMRKILMTHVAGGRGEHSGVITADIELPAEGFFLVFFTFS